MGTRQKDISIFQQALGQANSKIYGKPKFKRMDPQDVIEIFIVRTKGQEIDEELEHLIELLKDHLELPSVMRSLIHHRKIELFKRFIKEKISYEQRKTIVPDSFAHACIVDEMQIPFFLYETQQRIIHWRNEQCIDALVNSF